MKVSQENKKINSWIIGSKYQSQIVSCKAQNNKTTCHQGKTEGPFKVNQSRQLPSNNKKKKSYHQGQNPALQNPKKGRVAPKCPQQTVLQEDSQENQIGLTPPIWKKGKECKYAHFHFKLFHKTVKPSKKGTSQEINQIYDQQVDKGNGSSIKLSYSHSQQKS
ncbi:hypothetical protein ABPG72_013353 [Tetrahymena utriculariae]